MKKKIKKIQILIQDFDIGNLSESAAGCAYYTILAFIPLMILILTLTKYFKIDENLLIYILQGIVPGEILEEAVTNIVKEISSKSLGTITISVVFILWSAGKGFFALSKGLNKVYGMNSENKYIQFRLKSIFFTVFFIIAVVASLFILVFGNMINSFLQKKFNIFSKIINLLLKNKILISVILLTIIFATIYKFIPKHKYKFKAQIPGAIVSATICNVISAFFSLYLNFFKGFSVMYGSLITIVLAMMWGYCYMYSI